MLAEQEGEAGTLPESALIIRQPIFDREKAVWGYELFASGGLEEGGQAEESSLNTLLSTYKRSFERVHEGLSADKKILLNLENSAYLECDCNEEGVCNCAFSMCGDALESENCPEFAASVRELGGSVVLDCDMDDAILEKMLDRCDIVKVSMKGKTPPDIVRIRKKFKEFKGVLLVTDVATWEDFEGTRALGFKYFQGPFFTVPETRKDEKLPASSVSKLQLLRELNNPACEMAELSGIIASDVSLSYRILRYINSASFGFKTQIKSIQQAVSLLGLKELKHWATLVVMTDLDSTPKGEELAYMALQRGRFLANLARSLKDFRHSENTMFMLGLFSKLDALLSYPMEKALEDIPLDAEIKGGLCGKLNEFRDWLLMLNAVEIGNWEVANSILSRYGACFTSVATEYMKAATWAAEQLPDMKKAD